MGGPAPLHVTGGGRCFDPLGHVDDGGSARGQWPPPAGPRRRASAIALASNKQKIYRSLRARSNTDWLFLDVMLYVGGFRF
ncbi:hypothetical protein EVAR_87615_1 [Eumeta japonica]|uniref:Uncharacterized protein n=1 Tax=Eumeta variegata TaxID=151549 RepID=A0A4C1WL61_EUMVA|nr:hypothetical protein EVAR_87615_1 [Eumeta japonica]